MRAYCNVPNGQRCLRHAYASSTARPRGSVRLTIASNCRAAVGRNVIACRTAAAIWIIINSTNTPRCARVVPGATLANASASSHVRAYSDTPVVPAPACLSGLQPQDEVTIDIEPAAIAQYAASLPPWSVTIATPELVPSRVAPASSIASAVARSRTPPDAFTPSTGPTVRRISATSCNVAPP